jgi:hypothetical protein
MPAYKDHTGKRQGRLTVIERLKETCPKRGTAYNCKCDCGKSIKYFSAEINHKYKPRLSCGFCAPSRDYPDTWQSYSHMLDRCYNTSHNKYHLYGGRGITVDTEWKANFYSFLSDMGERPSKNYSLERIDNMKGYFKENCRWAMQFEQLLNTSRSFINRI